MDPWVAGPVHLDNNIVQVFYITIGTYLAGPVHLDNNIVQVLYITIGT